MSTEKPTTERGNLPIFSVMPCLVYFDDAKGIERIGIAEHYIDSKFVMVRECSRCRSMILETDLRPCALNKA